MPRRDAQYALTLAVSLFALGSAVHAQSSPSKSIGLIVPSLPGGGFDATGRILADNYGGAVGTGQHVAASALFGQLNAKALSVFYKGAYAESTSENSVTCCLRFFEKYRYLVPLLWNSTFHSNLHWTAASHLHCRF